MSEPYFYPDTNMLTTCCDAISTVPISDDIGLCKKCGEWSDMYNADEVWECDHKFETLDNDGPYGDDICIYCGKTEHKH